MREIPKISAIFGRHLPLLVAASATLVALYFAGHLFGNWATIARTDALFFSAPVRQGYWMVVVWAAIVGFGHALFLGVMIKEMYGDDDVYRHFMAKGDSFVGVTEWAAERMLVVEALLGVLTIAYRLVFCVALPVTASAFFTGYDTHANAVIFSAGFAGFAFAIAHSRGTPLSGVSTFICGIGFLLSAEGFGLATAFLLAFTLEVTQAFAWYLGKRAFWVRRRLYEEKRMGGSRVKLLCSWGLELLYILRLKRRPDLVQRLMAVMIAQEAQNRQTCQCVHKH